MPAGFVEAGLVFRVGRKTTELGRYPTAKLFASQVAGEEQLFVKGSCRKRAGGRFRVFARYAGMGTVR